MPSEHSIIAGIPSDEHSSSSRGLVVYLVLVSLSYNHFSRKIFFLDGHQAQPHYYSDWLGTQFLNRRVLFRYASMASYLNFTNRRQEFHITICESLVISRSCTWFSVSETIKKHSNLCQNRHINVETNELGSWNQNKNGDKLGIVYFPHPGNLKAELTYALSQANIFFRQ